MMLLHLYIFRERRAIWALLLICLVLVLSVQAQENTDNTTATDTPLVLPTEEALATETPVESLPTQEPTVESTMEVSPAPTETSPTEVTPAALTPVGTTEVLPTSEATVEPTLPSPKAPQPLPQVYSTNLDAAYPPELSPKIGWIEVTVAGGKALQANGNASPIIYTAATLGNSAVEARFLLNSGQGQVLLRGYSASLSGNGTVTLSQNQVAFASTTVTFGANTWNTLRLQIVGDEMQVSVNGTLVIDQTAATPIAEGQAGFGASSGAVLRVDDFAVYGMAAQTTATTTSTPQTPLPMSLAAPTDVHAAASGANGTDITITWTDNSTSETGYQIYRSGSYLYSQMQLVTTLSADTATFTDAGFGCGLTFWYIVVPVQNTTTGPASSAVLVNTTPCTPACTPAATIQRVNVGSNNQLQSTEVPWTDGNWPLSSNGRYVLFSSSTPLVLNDAELATQPPAQLDVYRYDLETCTTIKVSVGEMGLHAKDIRISRDGTKAYYMTFMTGSVEESDVDHGIYRRDLVAGTTTLLTTLSASDSIWPYVKDISSDERYLLLGMQDVPGITDTNAASDVVVYDLQTSTYIPASINVAETATGNGFSGPMGIFQANGRTYVGFYSAASDLVSGDTNGRNDLYLRNITDGVTIRISLPDGTLGIDGASGDGMFVQDGSQLTFSFSSGASPNTQAYVRKITDITYPTVGITTRVSRANGASGVVANAIVWESRVSKNGRWVAFRTAASNLVPGDTNNAPDIFVRDVVTNQIARVSLTTGGAQISGVVMLHGISEDGSQIFFRSQDTTIVPNDTNTACASSGSSQAGYNPCEDLFVAANPLYTAAAALPAPTNLQATVNGSSVTLTWQDNSTDETHFQIVGPTGTNMPLTTTTNTATATNVPCGMMLRFRVVAYRGSESSAMSDWVIVRTTPCTAACDPNAVIQRVSVGTNSQYQQTIQPLAYWYFDYGYVLSGSGRYATFMTADVLTDTPAPSIPAEADIYRYDTQTCTTVRVNVDNAGKDIVPWSYLAETTTDGNLAVFTRNMGEPKTYLRDIANNTTTRLLPQMTFADVYDISGDGRYVLMSVGPEPIPGYNDANNARDVVIYDRQLNTLTPVFVDGSNAPVSTGIDPYFAEVFAANGKVYVAFAGYNTFTGGTGNGIYLRNVTDSQIWLLSRDPSGSPLNASYFWSISVNDNVLRIPFYIDIQNNPSNNPLHLREVNLSNPNVGTTTIISRATGVNGMIANTGQSWGWAQISANGRYVAFTSTDSMLVPNDTNNAADVFVRDLLTYTTARLVKPDNSQFSLGATILDISDDGARLMFRSTTPDLVPNDTNTFCELDNQDNDYNENCADIFVAPNPLYPVAPQPPVCPPSAAIEPLSVREPHSTLGAGAYLETTHRAFSDDGRYVVFESNLPFTADITEADHEGTPRHDIYRYDRQTCTYEKISVTDAEGEGPYEAAHGYIRQDGDQVIFMKEDAGNRFYAEVRTVSTGQTQRITTYSITHPSPDYIPWGFVADISSDGRYVLYGIGDVSSLGVTDSNGADDLVLYDRTTQTSKVVTVATNGTQTANKGGYPQSLVFGHVVTAGGKVYVLFSSAATNLVPGQNKTGNWLDVFVRNVTDGVTFQISLSDGDAPGNNYSDLDDVTIVGDQLYVVFYSIATNLTDISAIGADYLRIVPLNNLGVGTTTLVSRPDTISESLSYAGSYARISDNGRWVVWSTNSAQLVANDTNNAGDVFVRDLFTNTTQRVSVAANGAQLTQRSTLKDFSPDGRYLVIDTLNNLTPDDLDGGEHDLYLFANPLYADPLPVPANLQATVNLRDVTLTWQDNSNNEAGFEIESSLDGSISVGANITTTNLLDNPCGTAIKYRIRAVNLATNAISPWSAWVTATTAPCPAGCTPNAALHLLTRINGPMPVDFMVHHWIDGYSISGNGRYVIFSSPTQMTNDPQEQAIEGARPIVDVYRYDTKTCITVKASVEPNGQDMPGRVYSTDISADGTILLFDKPIDNGYTQSQVYDAKTGITQSILPNRTSSTYDLSTDGRYVLGNFSESLPVNGVSLEYTGVYDRVTSSLSFLMNDSGTARMGIEPYTGQVFAANNKVYVVFYRPEPVGSSNCDCNRVYLRNMTDGTTYQLSVADDESLLGGSSYLGDTAVSGNTLYVAFSNSTSGTTGLYLRTVDLSNPSVGTTVSIQPPEPSQTYYSTRLSANGRWVAFNTNSPNSVPNDNNDTMDVFVRDMVTHDTARVSIAANGTEFTNQSLLLDISDDGSRIFFFTDIESWDPDGWGVNYYIADNPLHEGRPEEPVPDLLPAPLLSEPVDQVVVTNTYRPTFSWQSVAGAAQYVIQFDDEPTFAPPTASLTINTTTYTPPMNMSPGMHYWRVMAANASHISPWSAVRSTTINVLPLAAPALTAPAHQAAMSELHPAFMWGTVPGATQYELQIDDADTFDTPVISLTETQTSYTPPLALLPGTLYWRVRASNAEQESAWSARRVTIVPPPAPRALTPLTPTNGRLLMPGERPPTLTWSWGTTPAPSGIFTYDVEVATTAQFTVPVHVHNTLGSMTISIPWLEDGTYYWHVRAVNELGLAGPWSTPFRFIMDTTGPAAPALVSPAEDAVVSTARPTFVWSPVASAVRYVVIIVRQDRACDSNLPLYSTADVKTTIFTLPTTAAALPQDMLKVCVMAVDTADNFSTVSTREFSVYLGAAPANNTLVPTTTPVRFTWTAAPQTGATVTYRIEVAKETTFSQIQYQSNELTGTSHIATELLPAGVYYWRVARLVNGVEDVLVIPTWRRLLVGAVSAGPVLTAPAANAIINAPAPLEWTPGLTVIPSTDYELVISRSATFVPSLAREVISASASQSYDFIPPPNLNRVRYYWRVRGLNEGLAVTQWSAGTFIVDNVAPANPTITAPAQNALVNTVRPTFVWNAVTGAISYRVRIQDAATSADVVPEQVVNTTRFTPAVNLPQADLVLRVQASDDTNVSTGSLRSFSVRLGSLPAHNGSVTTARPTFTWIAVPNATSYELQIDNDPNFDEPGSGNGILRTIPLGNVLLHTLTVSEALPTSGRYFWRIKSETLAYPTNWNSRTLIYSVATPTPGGLKVFANGQTVNDPLLNADEADPSFTLSWLPLASVPSYYEVQISTNTGFTPILKSLPVNSASLAVAGTDLNDGRYYWRVRGVFNRDATSTTPWSTAANFLLDKTPPPPPGTSAPILSQVNTRTPSLSWSASPSAVRYRLTLVDEAANTTLMNRQIVNGTAYTVPLSVGLWQRTETTYSWLVEAEDAAGNLSAGFIAREFTLFLGTSPTAGQFVADTTPLFKWAAHGGASPLRLQIDNDAALTSLEYQSGNLAPTLTQFVLPSSDDLDPGVYYWRIIANNQPDPTQVHGQRFVVAAQLSDAAPTPDGPLNSDLISASEYSSGVNLAWDEPNAAGIIAILIGYQIEVSKSSTFAAASRVVLDDVSGQTYPLPSNLTDGTYYWRVRVVFEPNGALGPVSAVRTLRLDTTAPTVPALSTPMASAYLTATNRPALVWSASGGVPVNYIVEIDTTAAFSSPTTLATVNASVQTYSPTAAQALANGDYWWRVSARDEAGNVSTSAIRRLTIAVK